MTWSLKVSYFVDKYAMASIQQGITTEVIGNCGLGLAPMTDLVKNYYDQYISFIIGEIEFQPFKRLADFMNYVEKNGCSLNLAYLIPQGNIRAAIMEMDDRYPSPNELEHMKELVAQGMQDGAFGLSTGLIYPPGSNTTTQELIELCQVIKQYGGIYASHIRDEGIGVVSAISEAIEIGRRSGVPVQISHIKVAGAFPGKRFRMVKEIINKARAENLDIMADTYPYTAGNAVLSSLLPPWVFEGGKEQFLKNLSDAETRKRIIKEFKEFIWTIAGIPWYLRFIPKSIWLRLLPRILSERVLLTSLSKHTNLIGKTLKEAVAMLYPGKPLTEAVIDLLIEEEGQIVISMFLMKEKNVLEFMEMPFVMFSTDNLSTKGGNPHPRVYGTYPRILSCKKLKISLEELIHKMTFLPAQRLKLTDRGIIKTGKKADLVVFDPKTIKDMATHENPKQFPIGIEYVLVNGTLTVKKGKHTHQLSGQVLKHKN
ncbi:MAG: N-acyl-D-amino-acid deacylase family protein [Candidatus Helarchaeota archaeon]